MIGYSVGPVHTLYLIGEVRRYPLDSLRYPAQPRERAAAIDLGFILLDNVISSLPDQLITPTPTPAGSLRLQKLCESPKIC